MVREDIVTALTAHLLLARVLLDVERPVREQWKANSLLAHMGQWYMREEAIASAAFSDIMKAAESVADFDLMAHLERRIPPHRPRIFIAREIHGLDALLVAEEYTPARYEERLTVPVCTEWHWHREAFFWLAERVRKVYVTERVARAWGIEAPRVVAPHLLPDEAEQWVRIMREGYRNRPCPLCGSRAKSLNAHLRQVHAIQPEEARHAALSA